MTYEEDLVDRLRTMLAGEPELVEKKMFGGLAFMVAGHLALAASSRGGLMLRTDPNQDDLLVDPRVEPFVMNGRAMRGWLHVDVDRTATAEELQPFVDHGLRSVRSLPPK